MINFFKGILCGVGAVIPGLSGSVLLVIFGLYQKTIKAIGTLFKDFKKNFLFLLPLGLGIVLGMVFFSKIIDFALNNFEMVTRFIFFGLILGTIPLFHKEVKKEGFSNKYYLFTLVAFLLGFYIFFINADLFPRIDSPNLIQSVIMGFVVAMASIVPGLDSASTLSSLGMYESFVSSVANLNFNVLIPAVFGLGIGVLLLSFVMNKLISHFYTATFSSIFGLFLSILPRVLTDECYRVFGTNPLLYILAIIIGFSASYYFSDIKGNNEKLKALFNRN